MEIQLFNKGTQVFDPTVWYLPPFSSTFTKSVVQLNAQSLQHLYFGFKYLQ